MMPDRRRFSSRVSLLERVATMRRQASDASAAGVQPSPPDEDESPLAALEARVAHLEAALEGLQDAVHRDSVRYDERITELQRKLQPGEIARALSSDARERGL
jgi:hypothetical protein